MDFLPDSDLFNIIVIRKGSFGFGTFGLGKKWHQRTVCSTVKTMIFFLILKQGRQLMLFSTPPAQQICIYLSPLIISCGLTPTCTRDFLFSIYHHENDASCLFLYLGATLTNNFVHIILKMVKKMFI